MHGDDESDPEQGDRHAPFSRESYVISMSMIRFYRVGSQQTPQNETTNGTDKTNETTEADTLKEAFKPEEVGAIGEFLRDTGVPYPEAFGALITFFIVLVVAYLLGRTIVVPVTRRVLIARDVTQHARRPLLRLVKVIVGIVSFGIAFGLAGYGDLLTALTAVSAAATLAIGFALQDTLANLVAGVFIYTDRPFRIGDWIEWSSGSPEPYQGIVEDITFRVTRVRTFDNELLTVPNSALTQNVIKNPVAKDELRISVTFGISYEDDIEEASESIRKEAHKHPDILNEPAPVVQMSSATALAETTVNLTALIWIADPSRADYMQIRSEFITNVKNRFDEIGVEMPYPKIDLSGEIGLSSNSSDQDTPNHWRE
jgi:small conductance mechanosensitive channel